VFQSGHVSAHYSSSFRDTTHCRSDADQTRTDIIADIARSDPSAPGSQGYRYVCPASQPLVSDDPSMGATGALTGLAGHTKGLPCPGLLVRLASIRSGAATIKEFHDSGKNSDPRQPQIRQGMAELLVTLVRQAREVRETPSLVASAPGRPALRTQQYARNGQCVTLRGWESSSHCSLALSTGCVTAYREVANYRLQPVPSSDARFTAAKRLS
jgi:hypothetical protein